MSSKDTILYVNGVMQRCGCGCNVFRKISETPTENQYQCNACPATYSGAPKTSCSRSPQSSKDRNQ
jgi:hypothetical protein